MLPSLVGVIPSLAVIGPAALVMALFPGVGARLAVGLTRWRAFLAVASANSTLALAYWALRESRLLPDWRWVFTYRGFTALLLASTAAGLVWAGRRYRRMAGEDAAVTALPRRGEFLALGGLIGFIALILAVVRLISGSWGEAVNLPTREFTLIGLALVAAVLYGAYRVATRNTDGPAPAVRLSLSGETVALGTLFLGGLVALLVGGPAASPPASLVGTQTGDAEGGYGPRLADAGVFEIPDATQVLSGLTLDGGRLYFGTSRAGTFGATGAVVCLDAATGKPVWTFDHGGGLKPVFSTPTVAGGRVYFGEGLHADLGCQLYCVNAADGTPAWAQPFGTTSHTEGNPLVAGGRVVFTAGDDGLFCADAATGELRWQLDGRAHKLHIDGPPAGAGNRVFVGSGLHTRALLAVAADTGKELWRTPVGLRSFGPPLVVGDRVVYGLGTGNMSADTFKYPEEPGVPEEAAPAGAVVCVDAATGQQVWRYDLERSVHTALAADAFSVYAAARDGAVHCLDRGTGKLRWKTAVGATCTAGPAVATAGGMPVAVYAVSTEGLMACLNPQTGRVLWARDLREQTGKLVDEVYAAPVVATEPTPTGSRRVVYTAGQVTSPNTGAKTAAVFRFVDVLGD